MYCIVKTIIGNSGATHKLYMAGSRSLPEFRRPGHSVTGVGIDALLTWKTERGAERYKARFRRADLSVVSVV